MFFSVWALCQPGARIVHTQKQAFSKQTPKRYEFKLRAHMVVLTEITEALENNKVNAV